MSNKHGGRYLVGEDGKAVLVDPNTDAHHEYPKAEPAAPIAPAAEPVGDEAKKKGGK